jgi:hypothetical protein
VATAATGGALGVAIGSGFGAGVATAGSAVDLVRVGALGGFFCVFGFGIVVSFVVDLYCGADLIRC